jgi:hypothetical protein
LISKFSFLDLIIEKTWVLDQSGRSSLELHGVEFLCLQVILEVLERFPWVDLIATCEEVSSSISKLRPSVDAKVALLNDNNRRHTMW